MFGVLFASTVFISFIYMYLPAHAKFYYINLHEEKFILL